MRIIFSRLIALILTASLIIVVNPSFAVAWDQHPQNYKTHQEINKQAVSHFYAIYSNSSKYTSGAIDKTKSYMGPKVVSNSTFEGDHKVTGEALTFEEWLIHGGYSADEPNFWASVKHFYNPVKANGPQQLTDHSIVHGQVYDAISALDWTFAHPDNPYSWMDALAYYKKALEIPVSSQGKEAVPGSNFRDPPFPLASDKERREIYLGKAFRSLGETMHAVADVTQPAHVRNDSHPLVDPDPLEEVIKDFHVTKYANSPVDPRIGDKIDAAQDAYTIYQEVALYTNKYFYSNDTIYDGPSHANPANGENPYNQPQFSDLRLDDNKITYSAQFNGNWVPMVQKSYISRLNEQHQIEGRTANEAKVTTEYHVPPEFADGLAKVLLPVAIKANAKLIDLFFPTLELTIHVDEENDTGDFQVTGEMKHLSEKDPEWRGQTIKYCGPAELWCDRKGKALKIGEAEFEAGLTKKPLVVYTVDEPRESKDDIKVEKSDTLYLIIEAGGRTFTSNKFKLGPEDITIDPLTLDGEPGKPYTFKAIISSPPAKARYEWTVDGALQKTQGRELNYTFSKEGSYTITCKLYNDASADKKPIGEATASATIKSGSNTPAMVRDCKYISFVLNPKANLVHNNYKDDPYKKDADTRKGLKFVVNEINIPITWSGVNFSGKYKGKPSRDWYKPGGGSVSPDYIEDCTISGSVTSDGKIIKQLKMTIIYTLASEGYVETWQYEFTDVPFIEKHDLMHERDAAMRTLLLEYEVYSSNNAEAHGKFSATYLGKPESYRSLDGKDKMTDGKGTARNTMWEYYNIPELGPIIFGLKVNKVELNGL